MSNGVNEQSTYHETRIKFIADWTRERELNRRIVNDLETITEFLVKTAKEGIKKDPPIKIDAGTRDNIYKFFSLTNKVAVDQIKCDQALLSLIQDGEESGNGDDLKRVKELFSDQLSYLERLPAENRSDAKLRALTKMSEVIFKWDNALSILDNLAKGADEDGKLTIDAQTVKDIREQIGL